MLGAGAKQRDAASPSSAADEPVRTLRRDAAHAAMTGSHVAMGPRRTRRARGTPLDGVVWLVALIGLTALSCGGVLMAWSLATGRADLWGIGAPVAGGGLAALALTLGVVLVLRLDRLGSESRRTEARLAQVNNQLHRLETAAVTLSSPAHHSPSGAFYGHLADGASPQLLLADLKSQLDLLAVKITSEP
ncbi:MAG: hypothetical protein JW809_14565 [Pirellulales bacterium]|nr:hypothetical protein [Pirellulales bacterium]